MPEPIGNPSQRSPEEILADPKYNASQRDFPHDSPDPKHPDQSQDDNEAKRRGFRGKPQ